MSLAAFRLPALAFFAVAGIALSAQASRADDDVTSYRSFEDCGRLQESAARLACFDTVLKGGVFTLEKLERVREDSFGKTSAIREEVQTTQDGAVSDIRPTQSTRLEVEIVRVSKDPHGKMTFYLSNDQVWKQIGSGSLVMNELPLGVVIKKASLGSFRLSPVGSPRAVTVKRLK